MSTATSLTYLQYGNTSQAMFEGRGKNWVRGTAVIPSGATACSITNIPVLSPGSIVRVFQQVSSGATAKLGYLKNLSVYGDVGTIFIGTKNGSAVGNDTAFMFDVKHY